MSNNLNSNPIFPGTTPSNITFQPVEVKKEQTIVNEALRAVSFHHTTPTPSERSIVPLNLQMDEKKEIQTILEKHAHSSDQKWITLVPHYLTRSSTFSEFEAMLNSHLEVNPYSIEARAALADVLILNKRYTEAKEHLARIFLIAPLYKPFHRSLKTCLISLEKYHVFTEIEKFIETFEKAQEYILQNDLPRAEEYLLKLYFAKKNVFACEKLAEISLLNNNVEKAEHYLREALNKCDVPNINLKLAHLLYQNRKNLNEAHQLITKVLNKDRNNQLALIYLGEFLFYSQPEKAEDYIVQALKLGESFYARMVMTAIFFHQKKYESALAYLKTCSEQFPDDPLVLTNRALVLGTRKVNIFEAYVEATQTLKLLKPNSFQHQFVTTLITLLRKNPHGISVSHLITSWNINNLPKLAASEGLPNAATQCAEAPEQCFDIGVKYYNRGDLENAENFLKNVTSESSTYAKAQCYLGKIYLSKLAASEGLPNAATQCAEAPEQCFDIGVKYYNRGDLENAENFLKNVTSESSTYAKAQCYLGKIYLSRECYDVACEYYKKALNSDRENSAEFQQDLGFIYLQLRDLENAEKYLLNANKYKNAWAHLGEVYRHKIDYAKMNVCFDQSENNFFVNLYKSADAFSKKEYGTAHYYLLLSDSDSPKSAIAKINLAILFNKKGYEVKALAYAKSALDLAKTATQKFFIYDFIHLIENAQANFQSITKLNIPFLVTSFYDLPQITLGPVQEKALPATTETPASLPPIVQELSPTERLKKGVCLYKKITLEMRKAFLENSFCNRQMVNRLISQKGQWYFDFRFNELIHKNLQRILIETMGSLDDAYNLILRDIFQFWRGPLPPANIPAETKVQLISQFLDQPINNASLLILHEQYGALTPEQCVEVCPTFYELKFAEFMMRSEHLTAFLNRTGDEPHVLPFFVACQDAANVRLEILNISHDGQSFNGLLGDRLNTSEQLLQSLVPCEIKADEKGKSATLSLKQWRDLCKIISNFEQPPCLILKRKDFAPLTNTSTETQEKAKRKRPPEADASPRLERQAPVETAFIQDTRFAHPLPKTANKTQEVANRNFAKKVKSADYAPKHVFHPLLADPTLPAPSTSQHPSQGELPAMTANTIQGPTRALLLTDPTKAWQYWMQCDMEALDASTSLEDARKRVLLDKTLIDHPIAQKLANLPPEEQICCFLSQLKSYQRKAVNRGMLFQKENLGFLLSLEMGLGKTLTVLEEIMQMMAKYKTGLHLVITPNSVLDTTLGEYKKGIIEAKYTAYRVLFFRFKDTEFFVELADKYFKELEKQPSILLKLLPQMKPHLNAPDINFYKKLPLKDLFIAHLKQLKSQYFSSPEFKKPLCDAIEELKKSISELSLPQGMHTLIRCYLNNFMDDGETEGWEIVFDNLTDKEQKINLALLTAHMLKIDPERIEDDPFHYAILDEGLMAVLNFDERLLNATALPKVLENLLENPSGICITSIEALRKLQPGRYANKRFLSLVFDEAQKLRSEDTHAHELMFRWITTIKEAAKGHEISPAIIFPTGTPFSNESSDFWNLLRLMNPDLFLDSTYNAMEKGLTRVTQLLHKNYNEELEKSALASFAYYYYLQQHIVKPLVYHVRKEDLEVKRTWNDRVPTRKDKKYDCTPYLSVNARRSFEELYTRYLQNKSILEYEKGLQRALLHSTLAQKGLSLNSKADQPEIRRLFNIVKEGTSEEFDHLIKDSPILNTLIGTSVPAEETIAHWLQQAIENKESMVILIDTIKTGEFLQAALKRKYGTQANCRIFQGTLNRDAKEQYIQWFNEDLDDGTCHILFLSVKSGGVGLNLPKGKYVLDLTKLWVPSDRDQAIARVLRVGNLGEKLVITPLFGTHFEEHQLSVNKEKKAWVEFLWPQEQASGENLEDFFGQFLKIIKKKILHRQIVDHKDKIVAKEEMQKKVIPNLQKLLEVGTQEKLAETCIEVMNIDLSYDEETVDLVTL